MRELYALMEHGYPFCVYALECECDDVTHDIVAGALRERVQFFPKLASRELWRRVFSMGLQQPYMCAFERSYIIGRSLAPRHFRPPWSKRLRWLRWHVRHFPNALWLAHRLKELNVNHVHAQFAHITASIAMIAARLSGAAFSFTAHAYDIYAEPILLAEKISRAKALITCTRANLEYLMRELPNAHARMHLVYHGLLRCEIERFASMRNCATKSDVRTIIFVGRLVAKKGIHILLHALACLKKYHNNVRCMIAGDGPMRSALERLAMQLGIDDCVVFVGAVPHWRMHEFYAMGDVLVVPSVVAPSGDRDGLPNVILEAAAIGVPIIGSDVSGIPEFITDGETGLLVPPNDAHALANAIEHLLSDDELMAKLCDGARQRLCEQFTAEENVLKLTRIWDACIANS